MNGIILYSSTYGTIAPRCRFRYHRAMHTLSNNDHFTLNGVTLRLPSRARERHDGDP